jgi:hypothetical protein
MDNDKKILYGFVLFGFVSLIIFYNLKAVPDYGIRTQDFQLKDIERIVVIKYPNKEEVTLVDSVDIKPIIEQLLKSKETNIRNPKAGPSLYNLKLFYKSKDKNNLKMDFVQGTVDGKWYHLISTDYKNDSLFTVLSLIKF